MCSFPKKFSSILLITTSSVSNIECEKAVMCHGDMTLEHPEIDNAHDVILTGWGNTHLCRDWESVVTAISKHAIKHKAEGWARFEEGELKTIRGL